MKVIKLFYVDETESKEIKFSGKIKLDRDRSDFTIYDLYIDKGRFADKLRINFNDISGFYIEDYKTTEPLRLSEPIRLGEKKW